MTHKLLQIPPTETTHIKKCPHDEHGAMYDHKFLYNLVGTTYFNDFRQDEVKESNLAAAKNNSMMI
jgi:hypothetical protein